jgi:hypothetical protein
MTQTRERTSRHREVPAQRDLLRTANGSRMQSSGVRAAERRSSVVNERRDVFDLTGDGLGRVTDVATLRALLFAQGLNERGGRLPLASDYMSEEELRPNHIVAHRQRSHADRSAHAEVYRRADRFEDGQPNITDIRPIGASVLRGAPRRPGNGAVTRQTTPSSGPAPTARVARETAQAATVRTSPSHRASASTAATPGQSRSMRATASNERVGRATAGTQRGSRVANASTQRPALEISEPAMVAGALALAPQAESRSAREGAPSRASLRVVTARRRPWGLYAVIMFWTLFLFAFLFAAVAMHAGLAQNQVSLDLVNVELEKSEARNAQLRVDVARLESPSRIAETANRLGLNAPKQTEFLTPAPAPSPAPSFAPSSATSSATSPATSPATSDVVLDGAATSGTQG